MELRRSAAVAISRRVLFFGATFASAALATWLMLDIVRANGLSLLEALSVPLFFVLFTWITGAFYTAIAGFFVQLIGKDSSVIRATGLPETPLRKRTALIMPIYNEDADRVAAGVDAIWTSLSAQRESDAFDFFLLSDTRDPDIAAAEESHWRALVERHNAGGRIYYRRRERNVGRKSGNVADFVRNWGAAYEHMVVLDADSVMSGHALVTMARLMEGHPRVGILQALPMPAGRESLFARFVQFAARINGPMLSSGLAFWQLGESNYWGHNAIIRVRPFARACALPKLAGRAPFGGEILSHDFVEAAFMRRAGYEVWLLTDLEGSWEEVPSNIIDYAARDRRWSQGNLQHIKVMPLKGLHWLSRLHMLTGILSYATSPIWLAVLLVSSVLTSLAALHGHVYFEPGAYVLFPQWPESRLSEIASLLTVTLVVLLTPKVLGALLVLRDPVLLRGFGGPARLGVSLLAEQLFSMLLAPAMMVFHATFVLSTLAGKPVAWNAQARSDRGVTWRDALERHRWHILLAIAWAACLQLYAPRFLPWMLPVLIGLVAGPALTVLTSRASLGRAWLRRGLLLTPHESAPPTELQALAQGAPARIAADTPAPQAVPDLAMLSMDAEPVAYPSLRTAFGVRAPQRLAPAVAGTVGPMRPGRDSR